MSRSDETVIETRLLGYLVEALASLRGWMRNYFSTAGLLVLVLLVAALQLERDCRSLSEGTLLQIPPHLSQACWKKLGFVLEEHDGTLQLKTATGSEASKPEITMFGVELIRDYFSLVFGAAYFAFVTVLRFRCRTISSLLDRLDSLHGTRVPKRRLAHIVRGFPWAGSPFLSDRIGPAIFWGGLLTGLALLALTVLAHIVLQPEPLIIGKGVYVAIGWVNLVMFVAALWCLYGVRQTIVAVHARLTPTQEDSPADAA